ncbi:hypothetical protein BO94DRAFT_280104 [Aspergillus sclerotioniger CBS 115572]|uniref:Zn(2)-C6 fungal-type domain-containing protein n=1 Tax=Aspergillus sclerotioniger CBS 115572 TaxID=1450535 RepID=A0A317X7P0_9EURO|nr:hypothetical protein BO94DRAFT_280104 [Aspergillus sclerotioniger CBS 115572]PWY94623.1 hypothetical protein BO94DRAFT_280104 [Aspergillus sclerotioniger CBS 115572]
MPGVPSNKACERCKKRHLKCDETRPNCQRCTNAGVECPGYVQTRKFIDQGASVRRRYAPYRDSDSKRGTPDSPRRITRESPAGIDIDGSVTGDMISQSTLSSQRTASSAADQLLEASQGFFGSSGEESREHNLSQAHAQDETDRSAPNQPAAILQADTTTTLQQPWSVLNRGNPQFALSPNNTFGDASHPQGNTPVHFQHENAPTPARIPSLDSQSSRGEKEDFHDVVSELMTDTEHEISFLIRHFSQVIAPWLDLSDSRRFFATYVPLRAIDNDFVRYSIAALAAKHLGQMKGATCTASIGMFTTPATMETYLNAPDVDWFLKAANYYYLAITRMSSSMSESYMPSSSAVLEYPVDIIDNWLRQKMLNSPPSATDSSVWKKAETLLTTATVLTMYRLICEPGEKWQSYLTGVKPLFESLLQLYGNSSDNPVKFSHGIKASFWNFARQDYLASYFSRLPTYLDPTNLPLWRAAGLPINEQGEIISASYIFHSHEDLASNSLTWLMSKVTNFLAHFKTSQLDQIVPQSPTTAPISPPSPTTWLNLSFELQSWVDRMPETFRPCLRLNNPRDTSKLPEVSYMPFPEIYYSLPSCAASMQQYHFARLALCLNRPADAITSPTTAFDRIQSYREVTKEADYRCKEIIGISLARPQGCARIYMTAFLFGAGQCLEKPTERQILLDLLCGIGADLGWETESGIQKLKALWGENQ